MNMLLLAENIMIKDWGTISANTIEALKIMGMGILAIFIVIAIIMIAVYILNAIDNRGAKKAKVTAAATDGNAEVATAPAPMVETSNNVATVESVPAVEEEEPMLRSELGESKYRKTGDVDVPSKYRKNGDD